MNKLYFLLFCFGIFTLPAKSQTTLAAGDILFTGFNSIPSAGTAPDTFSFVVLTPITASTVIFFSDRGYQGGVTWQGSGGTEGTISWTVGTALSIGQEVEIYGYTARVAGVPNGTVTQVAGGNVTTGLSLGNTGDNLEAFQGGGGDPSNVGASFKCAICWQLNCGTTTDAGWNGAGCTYSASSSQIIPGLTANVTALLCGVPNNSPGFNSHGKFNCTGTPYNNVAAIKTAIMNKANWTFNTSTTTSAFNIPPACNYYNASLPVTLTSFTSSCEEGTSQIIWVSESEMRFDRYEIEISSDLNTYQTIAVIEGKHISEGEVTYIYELEDDFANTLSTTYCRLKMIDLDGSWESTSPITIKSCSELTNDLLRSYTFQNQLLSLELNEINLSVELFSTTGQSVSGIVQTTDELKVIIPLSHTSPQIYLLKIVDPVTLKTSMKHLFLY